MKDIMLSDPRKETGLLDAAGNLQFTNCAEERELRNTIVQEFLASDNADERATLLRVYETLMSNLSRSAVSGAYARLRVAQVVDRYRMGLAPVWFWRLANWRRG